MSTAVSVKRSVEMYMQYLVTNKRPNSVRSIGYTVKNFGNRFAGFDIDKVEDGALVDFLNNISLNLAKATKANRAGHISALYNFTADAFDIDLRNPCKRGIIKKLFKPPRVSPPVLPDKEIIEQIIYRSDGMDRLMLELMGKAAMRISEVLSVRPCDLHTESNTISLVAPKSGRHGEKVHLHQKLMRAIEEYVREKSIDKSARIFSISYTTALRMVVAHGNAAEIRLRPHDLRRHAATHASRAGKPLELISKVLLRHADIATTQRYLGTVSLNAGSQMMESLYG
jgi:integrase/recombinase XerD